jgi:hypothetical protein
MGNNAEAIGRLIASDTLLRGERQLLLKQEQPSQELRSESAQPNAPPISHNDKAMASVLLTLLDEQLDASLAGAANQSGAATAPDGNESSPAHNRIAAQYAEDDSVFRVDLPNREMPIPLGQSSQQIAQALASPELQTFMQRYLISAAGRIQADGAEGSPGGARRRNIETLRSALPMTRIAGAMLAIALLSIIIAASFAG